MTSPTEENMKRAWTVTWASAGLTRNTKQPQLDVLIALALDEAEARGALKEREACASLASSTEDYGSDCGDTIADRIRARTTE